MAENSFTKLKLQEFQAQLYELSPAHSCAKDWHEQQLQLFLQQGLPTRSHEDWKYTNISALLENPFQIKINKPIEKLEIDLSHHSIPGTYQIVFIDGHYHPTLSQWGDLEQIVTLSSTNTALPTQAYPNSKPSVFAHLNAALMTEGLCLNIPAHAEIKKPIHLLYLNTEHSAGLMHHPRHLINVGENAEISFIEEYADTHDQTYFNNVVTTIYANQNSRVNYYKLQNQSNNNFHIANIQIIQQTGSQVNSCQISLGSQLTRDDLHFHLQGSGAECQANGFYYVDHNRHIDNHTQIIHEVAQTTSGQNYQGILTDKGRGVFNGKVIVNPYALKSKARQANKNLLLTKSAEINTKPELEIFVDDVSCTHSATIGSLDEESLFYLQSRGIMRKNAEQMMIGAFAAEVLDTIADSAIYEYIREQVKNRMQLTNYEFEDIYEKLA